MPLKKKSVTLLSYFIFLFLSIDFCKWHWGETTLLYVLYYFSTQHTMGTLKITCMCSTEFSEHVHAHYYFLDCRRSLIVRHIL